uniref:heterogeneous nuclear ribonucleoprotein M-like isoform X1 n=1 Tax=Styela clava TaxID=7725 RepID=UPI001939AA5C|nr:heterogeneous nuclear ribonucleoprotein M-like isoform X1 [Styela clava]
MDGRNDGSPRHAERRRERERSRPTPYSREDIIGSRPGGNKNPPYNRIFVSNIPYDQKWQILKDLFREQIGTDSVTYVELMNDEAGNSKGYGIVEFKTKELMRDAVDKMNGYMLNDRKLVVKEDPFGDLVKRSMRRDANKNQMGRGPHDRPGHIQSLMSLPPPMPGHGPQPQSHFNRDDRQQSMGSFSSGRNINQTILELTHGNQPTDTIFVANLDYSVSYSKLKEVFKLAGTIVKIDMQLNQDNTSRGMATITYETPLEALQAISLFNDQKLYDRPMVVRLDRESVGSSKKELPSGLQGLGPALNLNALASGDNPLRAPSQSNLDIVELEMLAAKKKLLESGLNSGRNLSGIPGLLKPLNQPPVQDSLGFKLSSLNSKQSPLAASLTSLMNSGLLPQHSRTNVYDSMRGNSSSSSNRLGNQQYSNGSRSTGLQMTDRDRIEMDIARVDSRIRDLDRSLSSANELKRSSNHGRGGDRDPKTSLFIRNLPFSLQWQRLKEIFSRVGNVTFADIKTDNGRSKGYGFVHYETPEEAILAVGHFNGAEVDGRRIEVQLTDDKYGRGR